MGSTSIPTRSIRKKQSLGAERWLFLQRTWFGSCHPHCGSQLSTTPVAGDLAFSGLQEHKANTHIHKQGSLSKTFLVYKKSRNIQYEVSLCTELIHRSDSEKLNGIIHPLITSSSCLHLRFSQSPDISCYGCLKWYSLRMPDTQNLCHFRWYGHLTLTL